MNYPASIRSFEYKNDYFYIVIRQAPELGLKAYTFCCGINISRFDPLCWGKAGICSNPAFKGLQLLRADVSAYCLKSGIPTRNAQQIPCGPVAPRGNGWYRETNLLIVDASPRMVQRILDFSVSDLLRTVLSVCAPEAKLPAGLLNPPQLQKFLDSISVQTYKTAGARQVAKAK